MKKRTSLVIALLLIVSAAIFVWWWIPHPADAIYVNGRLITMDGSMPEAEALAIRGDRIVGVGSVSEIRRRFEAPLEVDLLGKTVLPGLIDAHAHFVSLGIARLTVDLVGSASEREAAERVAERARRSPPGQWIRGRGWNQNLWPSKRFPDRRALDRVAPDHPVILSRIDGHALWVNTAVLKIAGITRATVDPPGGRIVRDERGDPTGVLVDNAELLVAPYVPAPTASELEEAMLLAQEECLSLGLTGVHDMGVDTADLAAYRRLIDSDRLRVRIYAAIGGPGPTWERAKKEGAIIGYGGDRLTVRAIKLYADGALGSRGAALIEPYGDDPSNRGLTVTGQDELSASVADAVKHGFQVCTHAIGDRANSIVLDVYEQAITASGLQGLRLRVEHAQVLHPDDIGRFARLGILPSMQPTHCTSDMYWAEARLGPERIKGAYAWRSLLATGVVIPCGSDFPVERPGPLLGVFAAITRRDASGRPRSAADLRGETFELSPAGVVDSTAFEGGWYVRERMTLDEVLKGYTIWAATAAFEESLKGSLTVGKLADFVVLSERPDAQSPERILTTTIEATYIGGRKAYERK